MRLADLSMWDSHFNYADAVRLTNVTAATLDNWLRFGHIQPVQNEKRERRFSYSDLLKIDSMEMLISVFRVPPARAAGMACRVATESETWFAADAAEIARGRPWSALPNRGDVHFTYVRDGLDVRELEPGEQRDDSIMLVFPARMVARRLLAKIAAETVEEEEWQ